MMVGCDVYSAQLLPGEPPDTGRDTREDVVDAADTGSARDTAVADTADASDTSDASDAIDLDASDVSDTAVDVPEPVVLRHPPSRPEGEDSGEMELVFAIKDPLLDQEIDDAWVLNGFDLDGLQTTLDDPVTRCDSVRVIPDGAGGVDNVFGAHVMPFFLMAYPELPRNATESLERGDKALVLRVRGYNGLANDPRVQVTLVQSVGMTREPGGEPGAPEWDGDDYVIVNERDFVDGDPERPRLFDDNAYVADGVLVARPPPGRSLDLPWGDYVLELKFSDATLTADINLEEGRADNLVLAGRWSLIDLEDALTAAGVCPGTDERFFADATLRRYADVRSVPGSGGPGIECDALSGGIGFTGYLATWDRLGTGETFISGCD